MTSGRDNHATEPRRGEIVLAFDFGLRRIGVATGNAITRTAAPLTTLAAANGTPWSAIDTLVAEWAPQRLVVGMPDEASSIVPQIRAFAAELAKRYALPVATVDERSTSEAARADIAAARRSGLQRRKTVKGDLDKRAACLIAERWLDGLRGSGSSG